VTPQIYTIEEINEFMELKRPEAEHFAQAFSPDDMPIQRMARVDNYHKQEG